MSISASWNTRERSTRTGVRLRFRTMAVSGEMKLPCVPPIQAPAEATPVPVAEAEEMLRTQRALSRRRCIQAASGRQTIKPPSEPYRFKSLEPKATVLVDHAVEDQVSRDRE